MHMSCITKCLRKVGSNYKAENQINHIYDALWRWKKKKGEAYFLLPETKIPLPKYKKGCEGPERKRQTGERWNKMFSNERLQKKNSLC